MESERFREGSWTVDCHEIKLDRFLRSNLGDVSWGRVRGLITTGKVSVNGVVILDPTVDVHPGDNVLYVSNARRAEPNKPTVIPLLHVDSQIIVVNKPAGISTVPFTETERGSLYQRVRAQLSTRHRHSPPPLHVIHRIDKETSGVVVFARTHSALTKMKHLFRMHDIDRRYVALVQGVVKERTFRSRLIADRGDGKRGSTQNPKLGREAITHVRPLEVFDSATLVECTLETGRTHQIRIHFAEAGFPLFGERVYGRSPPQHSEAPRLMLHARTLGFVHPATGIPLQFSVEMPEDMSKFLLCLRGR